MKTNNVTERHRPLGGADYIFEEGRTSDIGAGNARLMLELARRNHFLPESEPRTYWERISECRWGQYVSEIEHRAILTANNMLGKPTEALEVGCEGGRWSHLLSTLGWQLTCTDVSDRALEICKQRIPTAKCIHVDPKNKVLPCDTNAVDLLLCIEVTVVAEADWFLHEAARVLRPGGLLVSMITNRTSARGIAYRAMTAFDPERKDFSAESGIYSKSYRSIERRLNYAGFEIAYREGMCWLPFSRESNSPLVPVLTSMERTLGLRKLPTLSPWVMSISRLQARK